MPSVWLHPIGYRERVVQINQGQEELLGDLIRWKEGVRASCSGFVCEKYVFL